VPPFGRAPNLRSCARGELVDEGALSGRGSKQATYPLRVLTLALGTADDDCDVRLGDVDAFVQYPCAHQAAQGSGAKRGERRFTLGA